MSIAPADTTVAAIRRKIRRLTASSSESSLPTASIDQYINQSYMTDFAYGIKIDQMRSVYSFYTVPYVDRYPLDVNYCQGVRAPFYVDGIGGNFFKDRSQFYNMWPRFPTNGQITSSAATSLNGVITAVTQSDPAQVTSVAHGLVSGSIIRIEAVVGMVQLNNNVYTVIVTDSDNFLLNGINSTTYTDYVSGGTWSTAVQSESFTLSPVPFLRNEVTIGGVDTLGGGISVCDDGYGNLLYTSPNPVISVPSVPPNPPNNSGINPIPGMINRNNFNPGLQATRIIGTVNYVTGEVNYTLPLGIVYDPAVTLRTRVSQYQTGRPYTCLFWNNELIIRPIPKYMHRCEIEVYLTPVQFMESTDNPILSQWWEYIAYLAAKKILQDRQDYEGVQNLMAELKNQEALVLERQGVEEIGQRNTTIYASITQNPGWGNGWGMGGY